MITDAVAERLRDRLLTRIGAFFTNATRGAGRCGVCTGPATADVCPQCRDQRAAFGSALADLVLPLAYVRGRMTPTHQSEHHVYAYKRTPPSERSAKDLALMVHAATRLHDRCAWPVLGGVWDVVTFVPSARRPGTDHPAVELARQAPDARRVLIEPGPGVAGTDRFPRDDGFVVPARFADHVRGRHVLVVDDTWVSGAKAQSAALALRGAGATTVTVLCVGRWLRHDWDDHRVFIRGLIEPYDAFVCPVSGVPCR